MMLQALLLAVLLALTAHDLDQVASLLDALNELLEFALLVGAWQGKGRDQEPPAPG